MIREYDNLEVWFVTGAQLLYGGDAVKQVDSHSREMVEGLNASGNIPLRIVYKGTANSSKEVEAVMKAANNDGKCAGIITWMHTFSPAKMWIKGLQALEKPLLHFHTQYNAEIPWDKIDMDFMNLNQSAHGDIEFGHICTRMRIHRKVVVGYWKDAVAQKKIAVWARVAAGVADARNVRCLMFGMNMNNVAVTDGDRVEFEQRLGYHVDYYPVSSLMEYYKKVTDADADALVEEYKRLYTIKVDESGEDVYWEKVRNSAKAELALRRVLEDEGATAFTTNFDDLGDADVDAPDFCGFDQIPGLLEDSLPLPHSLGDVSGPPEGLLLPRGLHAQLRRRPQFLPPEPYARDLPHDRLRQAQAGGPFPRHWHPQAADRPPGVHFQDRLRHQGHGS